MIKNRINYKVIDKILEETKSTPRQLLVWLEWGFKYVHKADYICTGKLYLDKYFFRGEGEEEYVDKIEEERVNIFIPPVFIDTEEHPMPRIPASIWTYLNACPEPRNIMIARFKKHYKLK